MPNNKHFTNSSPIFFYQRFPIPFAVHNPLSFPLFPSTRCLKLHLLLTCKFISIIARI
jgi:hypothetical protein